MAAKDFMEVLKFNPYHGPDGRFASKNGGGASSGAVNSYIDNLKPAVEYDNRVEHWKKQIEAGNHRPVLVSESDLNRVVDGNHTLAAYQELGQRPEVYAVNRIQFLNEAAAMANDLDWIKEAISSGKAKKVTEEMLANVKKANPYHDERGRFTTASGGAAAISPAKAIAEYQNYAYQAINEGLRAGKVEGDVKDLVAAMDKGFEEATPTKWSQTVHRADGAATTAEIWEKNGTTAKLPKKGDLADLWMDGEVRQTIKDSLVGETFTDKGYMSTSKDRMKAQEFSTGNSYSPYGVDAMVHINVPKGSKVLDLGDDGFISGSGEQETILNRGSSYKIKAVEFNWETQGLDIYADLVTDVQKANPVHEEGMEEMQNEYQIYKTDEDKRLVFGWASISITVDGEQLEDRQKDMIDPEDLEEAAYDYVLKFRDTGEEHIPTMRKKGKLVESCVLTAEKQKAMGIPEGTVPIGWWIGFKIEDDDAWARVKNGTYKMFSIEGKANREPVEKARRDYDEYPEYNMWLEENLDATIEEQRAAKEHYQKQKPVAKTFDEILEIDD